MENNIVKNSESLNISLDTAKNIPINKTNEEDMTCTDSECVKSINLKENSLQYNSCERYVHYRCTNMPAYMIEYFVKKVAGKKKKWICNVSSEIEEAAKDAGDITVKRQKETIKKLAREVAACDSIAKAQEMMQQQKEACQKKRKSWER